jgi:hypothetical protein
MTPSYPEGLEGVAMEVEEAVEEAVGEKAEEVTLETRQEAYRRRRHLYHQANKPINSSVLPRKYSQVTGRRQKIF